MARKEELEITIGADGNVSIHVAGVGGPDCLKLTEELEAALGVVTEREKTSEYYAPSTEEHQKTSYGGGGQ